MKKGTKKGQKITALVDTSVREVSLPPEILLDPRRVVFLNAFLDRESPTWSNAKQSAIAAGFSEIYADNITYLKPQWLVDFIGRQDFVMLAETHLREVLSLPNVSQAMGAFGPVFKTETKLVQKKYKNGKTRMVKVKVKTPVIVPNPSIIKVKNEAAKIVLPAYDPKYGDKGPKVSFNFNVKSTKQKYQ